MVDQEQRALTILEAAVDWQEPVVLQRKCGHPLPALTDIGPAVAAIKHRSRIRYLSKKNSRILTNFPKLKKFVKIRKKNSLNARV